MKKVALAAALLTIACSSRSETMAHELAALTQIRSIEAAEVQYFSQFGKYAENLAALGPSGASLIQGPVAQGTASGYVFALQAKLGGFVVTAKPETFGTTGTRSFYADETTVIRQSSTADGANASSPEVR
jgi:type IV pilus assembly protein PilA